MNNIPRNLYDSGFFHIMVQGLNKEYIFDKNIYKEKYINLIKEYKGKYEILLLAYCIMDNHSHLLIHTKEIEEMSKFMQNINSKFALYYNKDIARVGYVFRGRFNSQYIDSKEYLLKCLNYIHMNPVKANMVHKPEEYKYSTYNDYINKTGIVNDIVLNKIFAKEQNYLDVFYNISNNDFEIMDIDREEKNLQIAIKIFLAENETTLEEVKSNKTILEKFCEEIIINKKYKQTQVAKLLKVNISTVSRIISKKVVKI